MNTPTSTDDHSLINAVLQEMHTKRTSKVFATRTDCFGNLFEPVMQELDASQVVNKRARKAYMNALLTREVYNLSQEMETKEGRTVYTDWDE